LADDEKALVVRPGESSPEESGTTLDVNKRFLFRIVDAAVGVIKVIVDDQPVAGASPEDGRGAVVGPGVVVAPEDRWRAMHFLALHVVDEYLEFKLLLRLVLLREAGDSELLAVGAQRWPHR